MFSHRTDIDNGAFSKIKPVNSGASQNHKIEYDHSTEREGL